MTDIIWHDKSPRKVQENKKHVFLKIQLKAVVFSHVLVYIALRNICFIVGRGGRIHKKIFWCRKNTSYCHLGTIRLIQKVVLQFFHSGSLWEHYFSLDMRNRRGTRQFTQSTRTFVSWGQTHAHILTKAFDKIHAYVTLHGSTSYMLKISSSWKYSYKTVLEKEYWKV